MKPQSYATNPYFYLNEVLPDRIPAKSPLPQNQILSAP